MAQIRTTGNEKIDTATSEIAIALHRTLPGKGDQFYYDEAMRLRDEIMAGTRELPAPVLPPWRPANNGTGKRIWFLIRGWGAVSDQVPIEQRYHYGPSGRLVRYASAETAQRAADRLNGLEPALLPATATPQVITDDIALNMAAGVLEAMDLPVSARMLRNLLPEAEGKVGGKPYQEPAGKWGGSPPAGKVCVGCGRPQGEPHEDWCPVVTGTLGTLPG